MPTIIIRRIVNGNVVDVVVACPFTEGFTVARSDLNEPRPLWYRQPRANGEVSPREDAA